MRKSDKYYRIVIDNCNYVIIPLKKAGFWVCVYSPFALFHYFHLIHYFSESVENFLEIFVFFLLIINCLTWIWSQVYNNVGCWNVRSRFHVSFYRFSRQYIFIKKNSCVGCNIVTRVSRISLDIIPIIWECNVSKVQSMKVGDGYG